MSDPSIAIIVTAIVAAGVLIYLLWRNRFRIKKIVLGVAPSVELEKDNSLAATAHSSSSVRISDVDMRGANEVDVSRDAVDISGVKMEGENKLRVDGDGSDLTKPQGPSKP